MADRGRYIAPRMRIAYLTHYAELYGANRSLLDLMCALRDAGAVEPYVLLPREGPLTERLSAEGITWRTVPWQPWMSERHYMGGPHHRLGQYLRHARAARERSRTNAALAPTLLEYLRAWRIDAVHVNSAAVGITGELLDRWSGPLIWHIREMPEGHYGLHLGTRRYGALLRKAARVIAISNAVRNDVQRYAGTRTSVDVIYNGVVTKADHARQALAAHERWEHPEPFTFLMAGLIHPSKGQLEAVRALARLHAGHPSARLVIAGDGRADALRKLVTALGLSDHVELTGFVKDMAPLLRRAHALLNCSRNEAMGRITVEAMASGLPVIGHNSGGTPELITHGRNGLLYPGGDEALAERMAELADNVERARALGTQALRDAVERFSVERYAEEVLEVYRSVLSRASA